MQSGRSVSAGACPHFGKNPQRTLSPDETPTKEKCPPTIALFASPYAKVEGNIAFIPLSKGKGRIRRYVKIDFEDFDRVTKCKWYAVRGAITFYARATSGKFLPKHHRLMHAFVMKAEPGQRFDHVNGDGLDCRKENLRLASAQQNSFNSYKTNSPHVTSRFKGVSRPKGLARWVAVVTLSGNQTFLGTFDDEESAARAYDKAALKAFGEFAKTNQAMGLFESPVSNRNRDHTAKEVPPAISGNRRAVARERRKIFQAIELQKAGSRLSTRFT